MFNLPTSATKLLENPFVKGDVIVVEVEERALVFNRNTPTKMEAVQAV